MSKNHEVAAREPPDGGWGWMIVLAVFILGYFTWGVFIAYPVFYQPLMDEFEINFGDVTWISGTHEIGRAIGHLTMPLFSRGHHYRNASMLVSLISAITISASGFMPSKYLVYTLLSFIPGVALGNLTVSSFVMVARYFDKKKYLALGIAQTGTAIGTLSLAPLFQFFVDHYGLSGAILLVGGLSLHCVVASALLRPISLISDNEEEQNKNVFSVSNLAASSKLLKSPKFWVVVFTLLSVFAGARIYAAFLIPLGNTFADANPMKSTFVLTVFCCVSLIARVVVGAISDLKRVNVMWLLLTFALAAAASLTTVWFITDYTWLFVNSVFSAIATCTSNIMVVPLVLAAVGESNLSWGISLSGFIYTMLGSGLVPLTGYLIDIYGNIRIAYIIGAFFLLIGSFLHIPLLLKDKKPATAPL